MPKRNRHRERSRAQHGSTAVPDGQVPTSPAAAAPPAEVRLVGEPADAQQLAARLLAGVPWPVAVISVASGSAEPFIDAEALKDEIGDLGEVVIMPTGAASWAFSRAMPDLTQVYGGAGRVYRADRSWMADPFRSPLRFAFSRSDSDALVEALARDLAAFAFEAGVGRVPAPIASRPHAAGTVKATVGASRAILELDDDTYATIWAELTVADVSIDHLVISGQRVKGVLDPLSRRLDVREALQSAASALAGYVAGTAVLARVESVLPDRATLGLFPGVTVEVEHDAITDNPRDNLEDLLTPGEIVVAHLASISLEPQPSATLRLDLVDDEDEPAPAPSLLPGGPPWLAIVDAGLTTAVPPRTEPPPDTLPEGGPDAEEAPQPETPPDRPKPGPSVGGARPEALDVTGQLLEARQLRSDLRRLELENHGLRHDREKLRTELRSSGSRRRKAERSAKTRADDITLEGLFAEPLEQFRFEVYLEWARRIPAGQKAERPLREYSVGPAFLGSLDSTQGVERAKVVSVVVEVLTGLAAELDSRELHPLRTGPSGGAPPVRRADGSQCMRVAVQRNTPGARRLHFWQLGDQIELSKVAHHDDMTP